MGDWATDLYDAEDAEEAMNKEIEVRAEDGVILVDLRGRVFYRDAALPVDFTNVAGLYVGSEGVSFFGEGQQRLFRSGKVNSIIGDVPGNCPFHREGNNVVFRTQNSTYEIDQEQKLFRRLDGVNKPADSMELDGEWQSYRSFFGVAVDRCAVFILLDGNDLTTSRIREVVGEVISDAPTVG